MDNILFVPSIRELEWVQDILPGTSPAELSVGGRRVIEYALESAHKFEVMFTEGWTLLVTAGVMLLCFGLMMALILPWKTFVFLTCIALALFIRYEKKLWLRILNILVFGTWLMFSILVALTA